MSSGLQFGAGIWLFGQFIDRYATNAYGPPVGTLEAIERAGRVGGLVGLDINYPFPEEDLSLEQVKEALERNGLRAIAVTPVIYDQRFARGSFTHPDPAVRQQAIELGKQATDVARALGADYVKFWPGQDGYDYPFQADHLQLWDFTVNGIRAVAEANPDMQYAIEYKAKEPRVHLVLSSSARTLLAIQEMGVNNVGIVMDLGHSLFAKETPAEALQLIARHGKLTSIEVNDNWREWDDDLAVASIHLIETIEFLQAVERIGWQRPILLDQFPFREDPVEAARVSIKRIQALERLRQRLDQAALKEAQEKQDALQAQQLIFAALLGLDGGEE
ncbi:sugar phosphate isomerase/epimerase family protein [Thermogemmatispora tikiterensis]|uniref:Xylose isomerase n=1 Tax=Thermogemmatispora tikiterensis TaxID=1825093 RepID=A0A328VME0_9CHLR|nr:TIM barrel protein [Thermogemmatispora tikiterensis]RAQ98001.1 xylose isomerase [Thermogemmatispora tikiterensis]